MAISVTTIAHNSNAAGATVAATVPVGGVPSGSLIVVVTDESGTITAAGTVGDTAGNTYTKIDSFGLNNADANGWGAIYYTWNCLALVSTNTITYTKNTSGKSAAITAFYATGILNSSDPLDTAVTAHASGQSTTPSVTSGTSGTAGELFVGAVSVRAAVGNTFTQDSTNAAWAAPPTSDYGVIVDVSVAGGNVVKPGTGTLIYAPTLSVNKQWAAFIVGFKPTPSAIVGIPWFEPPDILPIPQLRNPHPGPALALTPATLPPQIAGMAWFEPPDPKQPRPLERPHPGPAITISPPSLLTQLIGVPWSHRIDEKPFSRPIRDNSAPAIALTPATLPPQITGMAWFEPPDIFQPHRYFVQEPPAVGQVFATTVVPISGIAWFEPPDPKQPRPLERPHPGPAFAIESFSLLSQLIGVPWSHPPDDKPLSRPIRDNSSPAGLLMPIVQATISGMAWFEPPYVYQPKPCFENTPPAHPPYGFVVQTTFTRRPLLQWPSPANRATRTRPVWSYWHGRSS